MMLECTGNLLAHKRALGLCSAKHCRKNNSPNHYLCYGCRRKKQKETNPLRYWFDVLRSNANRRKIFFGLTLEEFAEFCEETNYLIFKGRNAGNYTIDRIRDELGYMKGNLQVLTRGANTRKMWIDLKIRFGRYPTLEELEAFKESARLPENPEPEIYIEETDENEIIPF